MRWLFLLALVACHPSGLKRIVAKQPVALVVEYDTGYMLYPKVRFDAPTLFDANHQLVKPFDRSVTWVELITTTDFYRLEPGTYYFKPKGEAFIRALRERPIKKLRGTHAYSLLDHHLDEVEPHGRIVERWLVHGDSLYCVRVTDLDNHMELSVIGTPGDSIIEPTGYWFSPPFFDQHAFVGPYRGTAAIEVSTWTDDKQRYAIDLVPYVPKYHQDTHPQCSD
ncbi:MAG: hypothetical protein QM831_35500 [Kofleriaceae bacterium]